MKGVAVIKIILVMVLIIIPGCLGLDLKRHPISYYAIWYPESTRPKVEASHGTLFIRRLSSNPMVDSSNILRLEPGNRITHIPFSRWKASPPQMIRELVARDLKGMGYFRQVITTTTRLPDLVLDMHLHSLWAELLDRPYAHLSISFSLSRLIKGEEKLLFSKSYEKRMALKDDNAETLASSISLGLMETIEELEKDLRGTLESERSQ